ncbi:MAG: hypothetical protein K0S56_3612 [Microvirga sp.]|nr:hypothetical protein [Microvirga sp.]
MIRKIGTVLGWGLAGAVVAPVLGFLTVLGFILLNPICRSPGDSGGCYMSAVTVPIMLVVPGAMVFALAGVIRLLIPTLRGVRPMQLARDLWRRGRAWPYD